ncbi:serine/arginine-rich splicing factor 4 isoform X2 [Magallana gigas]|uniref:serine/arginine-rich splicing factor 4 isoform X2 n=1 Tax=Magallana gigas TaxID=29159 RepID=UPI003342DADF
MAPERFWVLVVLIVAVISSFVTKSSSKSIEEVDDNVRRNEDLEAVYDTETNPIHTRSKRDADTEAVLKDGSATDKVIAQISKDEIEEIETRGLRRRSRSRRRGSRRSRRRGSRRSRRSRSRRSGRGRSRRSGRGRSRQPGRGRSRQSRRKGSNGSGGGSGWGAVTGIADAASTGLNAVNAGLDLANNLKSNNGDVGNDDTDDTDYATY